MNSGTSPPSEQTLLEALESLLDARLPDDWSAAIERDLAPTTWSGGYRPDGVLCITTPRGDSLTFLIETKLAFYPRDARWMEREPRGAIVLSRFLSPRTRETLRRLGVSYADGTGNLRLQAKDPPMLIELSGADINPWPTDRPQQSLKGPGTARVVRALLDFTPPYTLRGLAEAGDLPLGTTSRVVNYLIEEAIIQRDGRGPIEDVAWRQLLQLWAQAHPFLRANEVESFLDPRGPESVAQRLADLDLEYAVTGSLAAERRAAFAPPALATIYVRSIGRAAEALGLRRAPSGGNVLLVAPGSGVAFERTWQEGGLVYAATSQVATDLLGLPGRAPSEAEALIEWMEENEDAWRRP